MAITTPALLLVREDGTILDENAAGDRLLGDGRGRLCWEFMCDQPGACDLPCAKGCVARLLAANHGANRTRISVDGNLLELTCIATSKDLVACTLHPVKHEEARPHEALTRREHQVLEEVASGCQTQDIATRLGIRESTVRSYVEQMRNKLGVSTRASLVARAIRLGLIK